MKFRCTAITIKPGPRTKPRPCGAPAGADGYCLHHAAMFVTLQDRPAKAVQR